MTSVPEHCPGTESESAGKESACQGCPNQSICASGAARGPDPGVLLVQQRLSSVKHKILVLSGKGGVGKSTFSSLLARGLSSDLEKNDYKSLLPNGAPITPQILSSHINDIKRGRDCRDKKFENGYLKRKLNQGWVVAQHAVTGDWNLPYSKSAVLQTLSRMLVGILDIDICGPSVPRIMGVLGEQVHQSGSGWSPVYVEENLAVMSIGFLLGSPDDAVIWRGPKKNGLIKQFLSEVDWGNLDYLVIDTPPGTSDEHLSVTQYLLSGSENKHRTVVAIVVTTPQEVALLDVRKEIDFCKKVNLPVIGVVENMSGFICPKCKFQSDIFPPSTVGDGAEGMAKEYGIPFLGRLPLDPRLGKSCDSGGHFLAELPESPAARSFLEIMQGVISSLDTKMDVDE